jgi:hypothetical protein
MKLVSFCAQYRIFSWIKVGYLGFPFWESYSEKTDFSYVFLIFDPLIVCANTWDWCRFVRNSVFYHVLKLGMLNFLFGKVIPKKVKNSENFKVTFHPLKVCANTWNLYWRSGNGEYKLNLEKKYEKLEKNFFFFSKGKNDFEFFQSFLCLVFFSLVLWVGCPTTCVIYHFVANFFCYKLVVSEFWEFPFWDN